jgi:hypothetical protein
MVVLDYLLQDKKNAVITITGLALVVAGKNLIAGEDDEPGRGKGRLPGREKKKS